MAQDLVGRRRQVGAGPHRDAESGTSDPLPAMLPTLLLGAHYRLLLAGWIVINASLGGLTGRGGIDLAKRRQKSQKFTIPLVWRAIVKKNERQGARRFDVLICQHVVPANDNTFRSFRACPDCRARVQRYADEVVPRTLQAPRPRRQPKASAA